MSTREEFCINSNADSVQSSRSPSPEWLRRMREDFQRTGRYRVEDVRRLVGDQTQGVSSSSKPVVKP